MSRSWTFAIAAIVGVLTIAAYLWLSLQPQPVSNDLSTSPAAAQTPAPAMSLQTVRIDLDLRNASPKNPKSNSAEPPVLPRRRLHAAIVLSTPVQNLTVPPIENLTDRRGDEPQFVVAS